MRERGGGGVVIERKGGRTFSLRVLLRANFVFLFSKFSSVLSSLHTVPLCCSFFFLFPFFFLPLPSLSLPLSPSLSLSLCLSSSMVLFARLLVTPVCVFMGDLDTRRMRFSEERTLKVVSPAGPGSF